MNQAVPALLPPFRVHGAAPLLLVAGLGSQGTSWRPFLQVAASRQRVVTFDCRGAGASAPLDGPIAICDLERDALALLDHLGIERAPLIGRNMGGMIAQEVALLAPPRARSLPALGGAGRGRRARAPATPRFHALVSGQRGDARRGAGRVVPPRAGGGPAAMQTRACAAHDALGRLRRRAPPALVIARGDDRLMPAHRAKMLAKPSRVPSSP